MTTPFQATQSFVPTQIPGCQLWFDAADNTTFTYGSGASISSWRDKSSNAYSVAQATASNQPTLTSGAQNGLPGIQFSQSTYLFQAATSMPNFTTGGSTSVLMVARNASVNTSWNIINTIWFDVGGLSANTRYHFSFNYNTSNGTTLFTNNALVGNVQSNAIASSANAILGFTASATSQTIHTNGSTNTYAGVSLPNATGNTDFIFNDARNNLASANIMIFEMVGYNTQITSAQRQVLEGYFAWKWGLVVNLPADHPYKTVPILSLPPFPNAPRQKIATQVSLFQPTQLSGCTVWLDGADPNGNGTIPSNGSAVSSWVDKSSNGMTVSAVSSQPTYSRALQNGLGALTYNGTQNLATANVLASKFAGTTSNLTIFCVNSFSNTVTGGTYASPFNWANGGAYPRIALTVGNNADGVMMDVGASGTGRTSHAVPPPTFDNQFYITSYWKSAANSQLNLNGSNKASSSTQDATGFASSNYAFNVGFAFGSSVWYMRGSIGEILFYNSTLSRQNFQLIEGYLAWKWGLQNSLPSTHPYRQTPVYALQPFPLVPRISNITNKNFNPNSISGSALWLDAGDSSTLSFSSGTNINVWSDKSGNGRNATQFNTGFATYDNSQKRVVITTTGQLASPVPAGTFSGGVSAFIVFQKYGANTSFDTLVNRTNAGGPFPAPFDSYYFASASNLTRLIGEGQNNNRCSFVNSDTTFRNTSKTLYYFNIAATTIWNEAVNGAIPASLTRTETVGTPNYSDVGTQVYIGTRGDKATTANVYMYEIILYNLSLVPFRRQQVEGYLAWKWGLQSSLPANHPYKIFPPSP